MAGGLTSTTEEKLLHAILEAIADGIVVVDPNGHSTLCNSKFREMWQLPASWPDSNESDELLPEFMKSLFQGSSFQSNMRMIDEEIGDSLDTLCCVDGRCVECQSWPLLDGKCLAGRVWSFKDVTERWQAEAALKEREAELAAVYDNAPVMMLLLDSDRTVRRVNRLANEFMGIAEAVSIQTRVGDLMGCVNALESSRGCGFGSSCRQCALKAAIEDSISTGQLHKGIEVPPGRFRGIRSPEIHLLASSARIEANGRSMVLLCLQDISAKKQAELKLQESEEQFRLITERIIDVVVMVNLEGNISYVSPSVKRAYGFCPDEIIGLSVLKFATEMSREVVARMVRRMALGRETDGETIQIQRKDGSIACVLISVVPIFAGESVIGGQALLRDITESERLRNQEVRAQRLELAGQVAGQVAHDINNMLTPLLEYPGWIREELSSDSPAQAYLRDIERATEQIGEIIQELLTLGRRGRPKMELLDLNEAVVQVVNDFKLSSAEVRITTSLGSDLCPIMGCQSQLHRVLLNILINARDAVSAGGEIRVLTEDTMKDVSKLADTTFESARYAKITIADSGCGMTDEVKNKVFEPFFSTKTSDKRHGTGLGLSVVQAVMSDHEGVIELNSAVGAGTTVTLYFPLVDPSTHSCF
jgi:two-component system cell cycle sensor histidine kinase/response regulator CckA